MESDLSIGSNGDVPTFAEFEESTYKEPWADGSYIVDGDIPIRSLDDLEDFYYSVFSQGGSLIVHQVNGADSRWPNDEKRRLMYCISNNFGTDKSQVVDAAATAAAAWEDAADVDFVYLSLQDYGCTPSNDDVVFDIRPVSGQSYLARAFFPHEPRAERSVLINNTAFSSSWGLSNILTHEFGHALGFRHEHTRPEVAESCFEDNEWRSLTPYDSESVMHYPQCGGTGAALTMSDLDQQGADTLYGSVGSTNSKPGTPHLTVDFFECSYGLPAYTAVWWRSNSVPVASYDADRLTSSGIWLSISEGTAQSMNFRTSNNENQTVRVRACNAAGCSSFRQVSFTSAYCGGMDPNPR